jgi:hypothetical protein
VHAQVIVPPAGADTIPAQDTLLVHSPRSVFIKSVLLPGWGQAELGANTRGAIFFGLQTTSVFMLIKTIGKIERARSIEVGALRIATDSLRVVMAGDSALSRRLADPLAFSDALSESQRVRDVRAVIDSRQRHRQDWITYLLFFTMLSGVDAYVGAHLQDFPADFEARAGDGGVQLRVSVPIGGR